MSCKFYHSATIFGLSIPTEFTIVSGTRANEDPAVVEMLRSGIVNPPSVDDDDQYPRAAG